MILNSKSNQFKILLPIGFIPDSIEQKYSRFLKRMPTPFPSIRDYVNHSIQSITFPSVSAEVIEQANGRSSYSEPGDDGEMDFLTKNPRYIKGSLDMSRLLDKSFNVTFKLSDGCLNYWILFEVFQEFLQTYNTEQYKPNFLIHYLDSFGYQINTIEYDKILITGISEVEMNYSALTYEFRTFNMTFKYSNFYIKFFED